MPKKTFSKNSLEETNEVVNNMCRNTNLILPPTGIIEIINKYRELIKFDITIRALTGKEFKIKEVNENTKISEIVRKYEDSKINGYDTKYAKLICGKGIIEADDNRTLGEIDIKDSETFYSFMRMRG